MKLGTILALLVAIATARAQSPDPGGKPDAAASSSAHPVRFLSPDARASAASAWFDVTWYEIRLRVIPSPARLEGAVRIQGIVRTDSAAELTLDLSSPMTVDSVLLAGDAAPFVRSGNAFTVLLDRTYLAGELLDLTVHYAGLPVSTGFGSFEFSSANGAPWIWSLSEPYGSRDWWPCKDTPSDKADSVDIYVTTDALLRVGSNGTLRGVVNHGDGTRTHHWHEGYPIATYLVSVAMANYVVFSNWFVHSPGDSMEVLNYVLPNHFVSAQSSLPRTIDMLRIFSEIYGPYPFLREKYGHADIGKGGAMEHQTMTSTTTYNESTIAHELAHQWFGDLVTCRTWPHLWLNEGFAQYGTALYYERMYGTAQYWGYMNTQLNVARSATGTLVLEDTSSINTMFPSARVYAKGAVVLHMLRHVLGDTLFFRSLRAYAADSALAYGTATTEDFRAVCERVSGRPLGWFFDQWAYGENSPDYAVSWGASDTVGGAVLTLTLLQSTGTSRPPYFTMPLDVRVSDDFGDTLLTVWNDQPVQSFRWLLPRRPTAVTVDPDRWVLKTTQLVTDAPSSNASPDAFRLSQNYPNPFNAETRFSFTLPERSGVVIDVWDVAGARVAELARGEFDTGSHAVAWHADALPSGAYFVRATAALPSGRAVRTALLKTLLQK